MKIKLSSWMTLFICFLMAVCANAQRFNSAVELSAGYAQEGFGLKASYNYYHNRTDFLQASFLASFSKDKIHNEMKLAYSDYLLNLSYFTPVFKSRNNSFNLFFGGGPSLGFETISNSGSYLDDGSLVNSESQFIYGAYAELLSDIYLSDNFSIIVPLDFYYHFGSDLGNSHIYAGVGIRYFLN